MIKQYVITIANDVITQIVSASGEDDNLVQLQENDYFIDKNLYEELLPQLGFNVSSLKVNKKNKYVTNIKMVANTTQVWSQLKMLRNRELSNSDWTQQPDVKMKNKTKWATWRQSLRDIPNDYSSIDDAVQALEELISQKPE